MKIYKYRLETNSEFAIAIPETCTILNVDLQGGYPHLWCEVDENSPKVFHKFRCVMTGESPPENGNHVGTVQQGVMVYHYYYLGKAASLLSGK